MKWSFAEYIVKRKQIEPISSSPFLFAPGCLNIHKAIMRTHDDRQSGEQAFPRLPKGRREGATLLRNPRRRYRDVAALSPVSQRMIHQHQRQHRLGNRRRANSHARVMAAKRFYNHRIAVQVD